MRGVTLDRSKPGPFSISALAIMHESTSIPCDNGVLYEQVPDINSFSLLGPFLLPLLLRLLLLSTGFVLSMSWM